MLKKQILYFFATIILGVSFLSCQSKPQTTQEVQVSDWEQYKKEFFLDLWKTFPQMALSLGLSEYSSSFKIPNALYKQERVAFYNKYLAQLNSIPHSALSTLDAFDYELIQNFLKSSLWEEEVFKSSEWDPSQYNVGTGIAAILENGKTPENEKLLSLSQRLSQVPEYYQAAFKNISHPTLEHTEFAIEQNKGLMAYLDGDIKSRLEKSKLSKDKKEIVLKSLKSAIQAVDTYVSELTKLKNSLAQKNNFRSFRIGKKLYEQKFKFDLLARYSAGEIYLRAVKEKQSIHKEMLSQAKLLWPKYFKKAPPAQPLVMIRKVLDKLAENHVEPQGFVDASRKMIPELLEFVKNKNLLELDPKKPLKVRETPVYSRGFAGASVDAPGPFDAYRETYYNVTPLDGMTPEKQQSYLREYNNYTLKILNIHEAIPGHYVQLVYSLKNPSLIKSIFSSGAMIEGWAVYAERMMLEEGFGDRQPELMLMYNKWRLRVVCNTILDYSLHTLNMSKESAKKLLTDEAFQEEAQVEEKWKRATYSQVQLVSYYVGFTEIYDLRDQMKKKMGKDFDLKKFHESFLSYGSSPVDFIRKDMLGDELLKKGIVQ